MLKTRNSRGFTLAELAALLGVTALLASVLSPVVMSAGESNSASSTITVSEAGVVIAEPETLPVEAILVNVTNTTTGETVQKTVNDPNATSTTIAGLDSQANYSVEVAKQSQAGKSPAATAKVNYTKVGEKTVTLSEPVLEVAADSQTKTENVEAVVETQGYEQVFTGYQRVFSHYEKKHTGQYEKKFSGNYQKKLSGYQKKSESYTVRYRTVTSYRSAWGQRSVTKTRQVRVAPYERAVTKSRSVYVTPYSYTYSCTKSRSYSYRCGSHPTYRVPCGSESYTYSSTCTRTKSVPCGTKKSTYSCTKSRTKYCYNRYGNRYSCGTTSYRSTCTRYTTKYCNKSESYSCTKTGSRTKYCTQGGGAKYCTGTENYTGSCTGTGGGNYRTESYTAYEPVYNYRNENYTELESYEYTVNEGSSTSQGTCAGFSSGGGYGAGGGAWQTCSDSTQTKTRMVDDSSRPIMVDDTSKPIMVDDTSKPIMVDDTSKPVYVNGSAIYTNDVSKPIEKVVVAKSGNLTCPAGYSASTSTAYRTVSYRDGNRGWKTMSIPYTVKSCVRAEQWGTRYWDEQRDVKKAVTTAKEVKAPARQLVIEVTGTPTRSWRWATGTVASVGAGVNGYAKGNTVSFRYGTVFTFDGKKYIRVSASPWLVKKN